MITPYSGCRGENGISLALGRCKCEKNNEERSDGRREQFEKKKFRF
jgi:hypothetical protein